MSHTPKKLFVIIVIIIITVVSCSNKFINEDQEENIMSEKTIEDVLREHTNDLMSIPGIVGTAQTLY